MYLFVSHCICAFPRRALPTNSGFKLTMFCHSGHWLNAAQRKRLELSPVNDGRVSTRKYDPQLVDLCFIRDLIWLYCVLLANCGIAQRLRLHELRFGDQQTIRCNLYLAKRSPPISAFLHLLAYRGRPTT